MHKSRLVFTALILLSALLVLTFEPGAAQTADVSDSLWAIVMPSAAALEVDMGAVRISTTRDSVVTTFLTNTGPADIRIDSMYFEGADAGVFALVSRIPPFIIPENGTEAVEFRFSPLEVGERSAEIVIHTQVDTLRRSIRGEGIQPQLKGEATLAVDTIRARTGEIVEIPLYLRNQKDLVTAGVTGFEAELRFNRTLLAPVDATPEGEIFGSDRVIRFTDLPIQPDEEGVVARPRFMAMLGDADGTPLRLENAAAIGGAATVAQIPGYLLLTNVCREGGTRLYSDTGRILLRQNRPNPFNAMTVIEYEVIENGPTRLFVMDLLGRVVAVLVDGAVQPGRYTATFDAVSLASGTYLYILQTPTRRLLRLMEVVK